MRCRTDKPIEEKAGSIIACRVKIIASVVNAIASVVKRIGRNNKLKVASEPASAPAGCGK